MSDVFDLRVSARSFPDLTAISVGTSTFTYQDVWHMARATAHWLTTHGVGAHTKLVAVEPRKDVSSVITIWTLISLRVPFVLLHPSWSAVQTVLVLQHTQAHKVPIAPDVHPEQSKSASPDDYERLSRAGHAGESMDDPLCVIYTSGTTGSPKGVVLSRRAFLTSALEATRWLRLTAGDAWLLSLPLAHVGGMSVLTRCWFNHARVALTRNPEVGFAASAFVQDCSESKATLVSLVPTQLQRICDAGLHAPRRVRGVLLGGASSPSTLVERASRLGYRVARTYGLTEMCSIVATDALPPLDGTSPAPCDALAIHGHVQAQISAEGRLMLRGESLFSGYWGQAPRDVEDWFTTEDLAQIDDGRVRIFGRADDVIVTGGENVHPQAVEQALLTCPGVEQACVFARPSREWGQEVCAALVATPGFGLEHAVSHLRQCVPSFNIPRAWVVVHRLPTNANGKLQRSQVASELGPLCQSL